ncbi:6-phosphogluconolactonase [Pedobacter yulinensis]|uniref:6-phosphogluconolactonase n=1 Tax=Pedobacter yulinensis TaxID=2126353 RepID=A0A2T3HP07_9SPHI|nr:lactonase family protein [Pedobacter yulinensis]PST84190.1 6-phosphogluconolactonase [Pedobacter yulinensis]
MKKFFYLLLIVMTATEAPAQQFNLLIGTYTHGGKSEGIYSYRFTAARDSFSYMRQGVTKLSDPSYLCVSPDQRFVYAVTEGSEEKSAVSAFKFDKKNGTLLFLNKALTNAEAPCFVTANRHHVITANYGGGSLSVFGRSESGKLTDLKQQLQHTGKGIDAKKRQESAHVHMVRFTPDKKFLLATDLGEDHIYVYRYDKTAERPLSVKSVVKTTAGTGPRHLTFSPNGRFAYLVHEFNGSVSAYRYRNGELDLLQQITTIDAGFRGNVDAADIHVSPDGKFLYETNRGDANSISVFSIGNDGRLTFVQRISTKGKGPRNFVIDPTGNYVLVAHQYTDNVVIFRRDKTTGLLTDMKSEIKVGAPVCLVFTPVR